MPTMQAVPSFPKLSQLWALKFFLSKEISRRIWVRVGLRNNRLVILQGEWISRRCFFSFGTKAESYPMPSSSRPPALVSGMAEAHQCYTSDLRHRNRFVWRVSCTCYHLLSITTSSNCVVIYKWKGSYITVVVYNMTYKNQYLTSFGHWTGRPLKLALENRDTSSEVSDTIVDLAGSCVAHRAHEKPILHWTVNALATNIFIDNDRYWSISICYCV